MGFFSWKTKDTSVSIPSCYSKRKTIKVYMVLPDKTVYEESNYEGYGFFGGKNYYEALSEINGGPSDDNYGINIEHNLRGKCTNLVFPQLVEDPNSLTPDSFKTPNDNCEYQGYFY
ncbi:MAG: hypothetical protein WC725_04950 [Patescibacteria group bacterium]|jgi:hypothetical protein